MSYICCLLSIWRGNRRHSYNKLYPAIYFMLTNKITEYFTIRDLCALTSTNKELRSNLPLVLHKKIVACHRQNVSFRQEVGIEYVEKLHIQKCVMVSFPTFHNLKTIRIWKTPMNNLLWSQLGYGISSCGMLRTLDLVANDMSAENVKSFFSLMTDQTFSKCTYMDISANNMGKDGTIIFAENMWRFPSLSQFDSCSNNLCDLGMMHLAKALHDHCKHLSICHFFFNNIDNMGVYYMMNYLPYIQIIYMYGNLAKRRSCPYDMSNIHWGV